MLILHSQGMHSALTPQTWNTLSLPAAAAVQTLHIRTGQSLWLQALNGIVWLTCEGQLADSFLHPGQSLRITGPAKLYLGAQGSQKSQGASLRWCDAAVAPPPALAASTTPA